MKIILSLIACLSIMGCSNMKAEKSVDNIVEEESGVVKIEKTESVEEVKDTLPAGVKALIKAYPKQNFKYENNHIVFSDGSKIVWDDGKKKEFIDMMEEADIEDMFSIPYDRSEEPAYLADGGRCRCQDFFLKMYGNNEAAVRKNMVRIDWFGQKLWMSTINGVNKQLEAVARDIAKEPELLKYMSNSSSFNWRVVRGTQNRLSAHSYGVTLDVNTSYSDYWLWKNGKVSETAHIKYANRIPLKLVRIFERYGFIWGGHWYHYDTMHFEYRPEILINTGIDVTFVE